MVLIARWLFGARMGRCGWMALWLTAAGVALVVNPGDGAPKPSILLPLAAALFYALAGTITWSRCREESAGAMALNLNLCLCLVAGVGLLAQPILWPRMAEGPATAWRPLGATE